MITVGQAPSPVVVVALQVTDKSVCLTQDDHRRTGALACRYELSGSGRQVPMLRKVPQLFLFLVSHCGGIVRLSGQASPCRTKGMDMGTEDIVRRN